MERSPQVGGDAAAAVGPYRHFGAEQFIDIDVSFYQVNGDMVCTAGAQFRCSSGSWLRFHSNQTCIFQKLQMKSRAGSRQVHFFCNFSDDHTLPVQKL